MDAEINHPRLEQDPTLNQGSLKVHPPKAIKGAERLREPCYRGQRSTARLIAGVKERGESSMKVDMVAIGADIHPEGTIQMILLFDVTVLVVSAVGK